MQPNVSVLSKLASMVLTKVKSRCSPTIMPFETPRDTGTIPTPRGRESSSEARKTNRFADDPTYRNWIMQRLIHAADLGICDVETHRESFDVPDFLKEQLAKMESGFPLPDKRVVVSFVHGGKAPVLSTFPTNRLVRGSYSTSHPTGGHWPTSASLSLLMS